MDHLWGLILLLLLAVPGIALAKGVITPPLMLANVWAGQFQPGDYLVSEKLDGVRAYWDGRQLYSRSGYLIHAPAWFLARFPERPIDGELWAGRGEFELVSSAVRALKPQDDVWNRIRYMAFDLPDNPSILEDRMWVLASMVAELGLPHLHAVRRRTISTQAELQQQLEEVVRQGGEGLMLQRKGSLYQARRSTDLLKYKLVQDAEATVIGYHPGEGKYQGMTGSLKVRNDQGLEFRLGSGLTDALRRDPPAVGSRITYAYNGLTRHGLPRFARFVRVRQPE